MCAVAMRVRRRGGAVDGSCLRLTLGQNEGWFGNLTGLKYVFPTSAIASHVWFETYKKPGCGLNDDCAYNIPSIQTSAGRVASLIAHEKALVGGVAKRVFLAGFSEGAQLTGYVQLVKLPYALGVQATPRREPATAGATAAHRVFEHTAVDRAPS